MTLNDREADRLVEIGQLIEQHSDRSPTFLNTHIPGILKSEPPSYKVKNFEAMVVSPPLVELEIAEGLKTLRIPSVEDDTIGKVYNLVVSVEVSKETKQLVFLPPAWSPSAAKVRGTISPSTAAELVAAWEGLVRAVHARTTHFNNLRKAAVDAAKTTGLLWRYYFSNLAAPTFEESIAELVKQGVTQGVKRGAKHSAGSSRSNGPASVIPAKRAADAEVKKQEDDEDDKHILAKPKLTSRS